MIEWGFLRERTIPFNLVEHPLLYQREIEDTPEELIWGLKKPLIQLLNSNRNSLIPNYLEMAANHPRLFLGWYLQNSSFKPGLIGRLPRIPWDNVFRYHPGYLEAVIHSIEKLLELADEDEILDWVLFSVTENNQDLDWFDRELSVLRGLRK